MSRWGPASSRPKEVSRETRRQQKATKANVCNRGRGEKTKRQSTKDKDKDEDKKENESAEKIKSTSQKLKISRFESKITFFEPIATHSEKKKIFGKVVPSWDRSACSGGSLQSHL